MFDVRVVRLTAGGDYLIDYEVLIERKTVADFARRCGRQFSIRDINDLTLIFWQPEWLAPSR